MNSKDKAALYWIIAVIISVLLVFGGNIWNWVIEFIQNNLLKILGYVTFLVIFGVIIFYIIRRNEGGFVWG